jgi:hypothetical protein
MERKIEDKELKKVVEADYDSEDDLKELKEKWRAMRSAKHEQIEESVKSKKCKYRNSVEK